MLAMDDVFRFGSNKLRRLFDVTVSSNSKNKNQPPNSPKLHRTSFLDGMRGIAALIVVFFHTTWAYVVDIEVGYGYNGENHSFIQLPFVRLIHAGHAMVCVFFVIGGYVNAMQPLHLIHERQWDKLFVSISSSAMRRGIRLYIPPLLATLISAITIRFGWWEPSRANIEAHLFIVPDFHPNRQPTMFAQLADWWHHTTGIFNLWTYFSTSVVQPYYNDYDPHLWTVPYEVRTSLILMLVFVALGRCRPVARWILFLLLMQFSISWGRWEVVLFLAGALLAEIDMPSDVHRESLPTVDVQTEKGYYLPATVGRLRKGGLCTLFLVAGLYLLSAPAVNIENSPGYARIGSALPESFGDRKRIVHGAGAVMVTWAVSRSSVLQQPFLTTWAQHLGRISYSLYIVHGPILHMVGYVVTPALWVYFGRESTLQWLLGVILGNAFTYALIFLVANFFCTWVDATSVRISRAVEQFCLGR